MLHLATLSLVALALCSPAHAQTDYPTKPVRIMVGANAGGGTDVIARMLGEKTELLTFRPVPPTARG